MNATVQLQGTITAWCWQAGLSCHFAEDEDLWEYILCRKRMRRHPLCWQPCTFSGLFFTYITNADSNSVFSDFHQSSKCLTLWSSMEQSSKLPNRKGATFLSVLEKLHFSYLINDSFALFVPRGGISFNTPQLKIYPHSEKGFFFFYIYIYTHLNIYTSYITHIYIKDIYIYISSIRYIYACNIHITLLLA